MDNYSKLAIRYLKMNRRRSNITILGVVITTALLFLFLNLSYCGLLHMRETYRADGDYEMVFFTQTEESAKQLLADSRVQSAYLGPYYYQDIHGIEEEVLYPNCLYVNVVHPYSMERVFQALCSEYGVEGELNSSVASTYFQGGEDDLMVVVILFILLVAYIMAIFGVGIVRNAIQLNALENIRDYGNLRCIGATNRQLKGMIYLQGAILELTGIGIGMLLGIGISAVVTSILEWPVGFQPLILPIILILFMGDLYFTMGENSKLITRMSPVSAIRGEYRIRKEKIRLHKSRLLGRIFGVDGDYAYKSLMRNPKRFYRTIGAMTIGMAMVITCAGLWNTVVQVATETKKSYGYYQLYVNNTLNGTETIEDAQASLPSVKLLEEVAEFPTVTESRRVYAADAWLADVETYYSHYNQEYWEQVSWKREWLENYAMMQGDQKVDEDARSQSVNELMPLTCYGYDAAGIKRCQSTLIAGSLDISEDGIILVNPTKTYWIDTENGSTYQTITTTDYRVGDTISLVNMRRFREMMEPKLQEIDTQRDEEQARLREQYTDTEDANKLDNELWLAESQAECNRRDAAYACWKTLMDEGDYRTYTIEAILSEDPNAAASIDEESYYIGDCKLILPMEQYYSITGTDESMSTGMQYHLESDRETMRLNEIWSEMWDAVSNGEDSSQSYANQLVSVSEYFWAVEEIRSMQTPLLIAVLILIFIILMSALNFINATASNLHLRRKEFAQLQVIGASKKRIMKMTLLEGIITTFIADIFGVFLGVGISIWLNYYIGQVWEMPYHFPYVAVAVCVIGSFLLLVGSIYVPMRRLTGEMISDLTSGGD